MPAEPAPVLPEAVRLRVVALVADALGAIDGEVLPPALRRVAAFTPQRRARVAGTQIAMALETDERFRERVAAHVRAQRPGVAGPRAEAEGDRQHAAAAKDELRGVVAGADAETRRLRGRLTELEQQVAATRRGGRDNRDAASMRTRLLVDTLADAVRGLRRELALPAVDVRPADLVDAVDPTRPSPADTTGRALRVDDPVLLDQLLALPQVHLVVDGYNVTKTGYPALALDRQRQRLVADLAPLVARTGAEVTVVFDGAELLDVPPVGGARGVRVLFSPPGVIADELIRQLVVAEPQGRPLVVVSTDRELVEGVVARGARAVPSATLLALLARA